MSVFNGFMRGYQGARAQQAEDEAKAWQRQLQARQQTEWGQSDEDRSSNNAFQRYERDRIMRRNPILDAQNDERYRREGRNSDFLYDRSVKQAEQSDRVFGQTDLEATRGVTSRFLQGMKTLSPEMRRAAAGQWVQMYGPAYGVTADVFGDYSDAAIDQAAGMFMSLEDRNAVEEYDQRKALRPLELQGAQIGVQRQQEGLRGDRLQNTGLGQQNAARGRALRGGTAVGSGGGGWSPPAGWTVVQ